MVTRYSTGYCSFRLWVTFQSQFNSSRILPDFVHSVPKKLHGGKDSFGPSNPNQACRCKLERENQIPILPGRSGGGPGPGSGTVTTVGPKSCGLVRTAGWQLLPAALPSGSLAVPTSSRCSGNHTADRAAHPPNAAASPGCMPAPVPRGSSRVQTESQPEAVTFAGTP